MNLLDKVISYISPKAGAARVRYRLMQKHLADGERKYDGATQGHRASGWLTNGSDANQEVKTAGPLLRERTRELVRNNPYAERAVRIWVANAVGTGIIGEFKHPKKEVADLLNQRWRPFAETPLIDIQGRNDFYGLQALVTRSTIEAGEGLGRHLAVDDGEYPYRVQILEPDYIDSDRDEEKTEKARIISGIEVDEYGQPKAIYLHDRHPGDRAGTYHGSKRFEAKDLMHTFRPDRAGQLRGVSWFAPVMLGLRDFDDYRDAQLLRQKIAACYAVFIHDIEPDEGKENSAETKKLGREVTPGMQVPLPGNKTVSFANPPGVQNYGEFCAVTLRAIASGLGVTFEQLTSDLSTVNYSSIRAGLLDFWRLVDQFQWLVLIPGFCDPVAKRFLDSQVRAGKLRREDLPSVTVEWTPPRRPWVDPVKEVTAQKEAVRAAFTTTRAVIREQGGNPRITFQERADELAELDTLGVETDTDPRLDHDVQNVSEDEDNGEKQDAD